MTNRFQTHERLNSGEPVKGGSDRGFGVAFTVLFAAIGLFPLLDGAPPRTWLLGLAGVVLAVTLVRARWLAPFNRVWFRFGSALHRLVSPLVMALLFYGVVTPTGLVMRALRKDPLRLRMDRDAQSYWIHRDPPGPARDSMSQQF